MSPTHRDERRENAQRRPVEAHAADVNGEEDGDERRDPRAVGRPPLDLGRLQPFAGRRQLGPIEADVGDDALVGVALAVRRPPREADRDVEEPDPGGDGDEPVRRVAADQQDARRPPPRLASIQPALAQRRPAPRQPSAARPPSIACRSASIRKGAATKIASAVTASQTVLSRTIASSSVRPALRPGGALRRRCARPEAVDELGDGARDQQEAAGAVRLTRPERRRECGGGEQAREGGQPGPAFGG